MTDERGIRLSPKRISRFRRAFQKHFFLRFHMTLILMGVFFSGLLASKLLLEVGVRSMLIRYSIVVIVSYLMFFLFIRLWLIYVRQTSHNRAGVTGPRDILYVPDSGVVPAGSHDGSIVPGGGEFGGGGASGEWADSASRHTAVAASVADRSGGSTGASAIGDVDLDEGWIVLVILGLLLACIFGVGIYLIYAAPAILSDTALEVLLASSLIKASRRVDSPNWVGSVFKATLVPFVIVMILTVAVAWISAHYCPGASKLTDVFRSLWHGG